MHGTIVVADFDGTITSQDSNALLVERFGDRFNQWVEQQFIAGQMGTREAMEKHFANLRLTKEQYRNFILREIGIDPGFGEFYNKLEKAGLPLAVVSGGYVNAIELVLGREGIKPAAILANRLEFAATGIKNRFYHQGPDCPMDFGPCGNCKASHVLRFKEQYRQVAYIGDGLTDRCGAEHADLVYAKGRLAAYCRERGLKYIPFADFYDVARHMFGGE